MLRWLRRKTHENDVPTAGGRPPRLPTGERVYAIGDMHARNALLPALDSASPRDLERARPDGSVTVIYLGDYVDRGPESRRVIDHLANLPPGPIRRCFLIGNHDYWFRSFMTGGKPAHAWLQSGADATMMSYGVPPLPMYSGADAVAAHRQELVASVPAAHHRFLRDLQSNVQVGDFLFVHAGIRPGVPVDLQDPTDYVTIREPFLSDSSDLGVVVVHGHTVVDVPVVRGNRIGIDTGACWTGHLTAAVLGDEDLRFIRT